MNEFAKMASSLENIDSKKGTFLTSNNVKIDSDDLQILYLEKEICAWKDQIVRYLTTAELQKDHKEAHKIKVMYVCFMMIDRKLYQRGFSQPYLTCLSIEKANYVM